MPYDEQSYTYAIKEMTLLRYLVVQREESQLAASVCLCVCVYAGTHVSSLGAHHSSLNNKLLVTHLHVVQSSDSLEEERTVREGEGEKEGRAEREEGKGKEDEGRSRWRGRERRGRQTVGDKGKRDGMKGGGTEMHLWVTFHY